MWISREHLLALESESSLLRKLGVEANIALFAKTNTPCTVDYLRFGCILRKDGHGVLYSTHTAGLFSVLCTIMWAIREAQSLGVLLPEMISTLLGSQWQKNPGSKSTFGLYFLSPGRRAMADLLAIGCRNDPFFDHHGCYGTLFEKHLTADWLRAYFDGYMAPTEALRARADQWAIKYGLTSVRTVAVCYRGTDKHVELISDPVIDYIAHARQLLEALGAERILIQTDQLQVREQFCEEFAEQCLWIDELPATSGSIVMHHQTELIPDKEAWTMDLLAMWLVVSEHCCGLVTHTGNVGFFLAMRTLLNGGRVVQLR